MGQISTREVLQELVEKPIGSPALQEEAERVAYMAANGGTPIISAELAEAGQRANKKWLPAGKRSTSGPEARASREAFYERQIDLEEAIEAAGGQRGSVRP